MASLLFPENGLALSGLSVGGKLVRSAHGRTAVVYADEAKTTLASIYDTDGNPILGARLTINLSSLPDFLGPSDGTDTVYVSVEDGPAWPVYAKADARLDTLAASVAAIEAADVGNVADLSARVDTLQSTVSILSSETSALTVTTTGQASQISDLETDVALKANTADLATVATSGSYDDLADQPTIPAVASDVGAVAPFVVKWDSSTGWPARPSTTLVPAGCATFLAPDSDTLPSDAEDWDGLEIVDGLT